MNKVTVKQFLDAGFKLEMDDTIVTREGDTVHQMPDDILYDAIYIKHLMWRKNTGTQPVGDDCPIVCKWDNSSYGYCYQSTAGNFKSWNEPGLLWKPDLSAIAQLEESSQELVDGLPPIGEVCEVRFYDNGEWSDWFDNAKLKAGYDSKLWFSHGFGDVVWPAHDVEFRKPETAEQKEARLRDEELEKIANNVFNCNWDGIHTSDKHIISKLYDAGVLVKQ